MRTVLLMPRKFQIATHVADGMKNKEIAAVLGISQTVVGVHIHEIRTVLGLESRSAIAAWFNQEFPTSARRRHAYVRSCIALAESLLTNQQKAGETVRLRDWLARPRVPHHRSRSCDGDRVLPEDTLTAREFQVAECVAEGKSTKQIEQDLRIGFETLHRHLTRAYEKTGTESRLALGVWFVGKFRTPEEVIAGYQRALDLEKKNRRKGQGNRRR